jgi:hypothetical protein
MKTEDLIELLAEQAKPVAPGMVARTLALGLGAGATVSVVAMLYGLGLRVDLAPAMLTGAYWVKFLYTLLFAVLAFHVLEGLARPGVRQRIASAAIPVAGMALLALSSWQAAPPAERDLLLYGRSSVACPWLIVALSTPILIGVFWALRNLAPTDPVRAGAVGGLLAGAVAAFIYAFHCNETGLPFVAVWYSLGIVSVGALGATLGRWALRW